MKKLVSVLVVTVLLTLVLSANVAEGGTSYFAKAYDTGGPESYTYRFLVTQNTPLVVSTNENWNFTVSAEPWSTSSVNSTFYLIFYINDGVVNKTINHSISAKNDQAVLTYYHLFPGDFVANDTAQFTLVLQNETYVTKDTVVGNVSIFASTIAYATGSLVEVLLLGLLVSVIGGMVAVGYKKKKDD